MRKRTISNGSRKSSAKRRPDHLDFDEFGFALSKGKKIHRCHDYSYSQLSATRVKDLCELLSFWNGSSFLCRSQMERFIRMGVPPILRGRVWKCLLNIDSLRDSCAFNYQRCLTDVRGLLVDLGVSEYSILSAITTLNDTENTLGAYQNTPNPPPDATFSSEDVTVFRQVALDLQRSFPTHRSLMGESPEAIEGQAKLFRVLIAYAKYNSKIGYTQGMSYIAAVLLMHLSEEEAFWALVALLEQPKYLAQLFDLSNNKVQHQVKVFHQLLRHRKPKLSQHMVSMLARLWPGAESYDLRVHHQDDMGISPVHFVMPWFLTLFTSLPCWDSVLAVWDLIMLHGLSAVFRAGLTILQLLEPRLLALGDEAAALPLLLRVPVDVSQYSVLVPALWSTELQDWEITCMTGLVLEESLTGQDSDLCGSAPSQPLLEKRDAKEEKEKKPAEAEKEEEEKKPAEAEEGEEKKPAEAEKEEEEEEKKTAEAEKKEETVNKPTEAEKKEEEEEEKVKKPAEAEEEEENEPAEKDKEEENKSEEAEEEEEKALKKDSSVSGPKAVFRRVFRLAQLYFQQSGRHSRPGTPQPGTPSSAAGGTPFKTVTHPPAQTKGKRRSLKGRPQGVGRASVKRPSPPDAPAQGEDNRREPTFRRMGTGPVGRVARRRGTNLRPIQIQVKSFRLLRPAKPASHTPPPPSSPQTSDPPSPTQARPPSHTALLRELSTRCQELQESHDPPNTVQESELI